MILGKTLYIAEKPSVGRAIVEAMGGPSEAHKGSRSVTHITVGKDVVVSWLFGHVLEQVEPEGYDERFSDWEKSESLLPLVPEDWKLKVTDKTKEQFQVVKSLIKEADLIVHAGDPDREGQLLVDEVLLFVGNTKPVKRILPNAQDVASMKKILAAESDNAKFVGLYHAALARQRADWLIGMNMTRACTISNRKGGLSGTLSVGRVQTPTLAILVRRDDEIENFKPSPYFEVKAVFEHPKGQYAGKWKMPKGQAGLDASGHLLDKAVAAKVEADCRGQPAKVAAYDVERKVRKAPLPFCLSSLQAKAGKKHKMKVKEVLDLCQSLYEVHKVVSYPRSDCEYLPEEQFTDAPQVLAALASFDPSMANLVKGANPTIKSHAWNSKKVTAHHGIVPTGNVNFSGLSTKERQLFTLIAQNYLAQFYPDHEFQQTSVLTVCAKHEFTSSGKTPLVTGWKAVFGAEEEDEEKAKTKGDEQQVLPPMAKDESVKCLNTKLDQKVTRPPPRFTESTLVSAMTNVADLVSDPELKKRLQMCEGLGTPATQASIIETLKERNFARAEGDALVSTAAGRQFVASLPREITDVALTALWENAFDMIEKGSMTVEKFLDGQAQWVKKLTRQALEKKISVALGMRNETLSDAVAKAIQSQVGTTCPACGVGVLKSVRASKGENEGKYFLGCSNYPTCKHTVHIEGQDQPTRARSSGGSAGGKTSKKGGKASGTRR